MSVVWKFTLKTTSGRQRFEVPARAQFFHAHEQDGKVCVWATVNEHAPAEVRWLGIIRTGWDFDSDAVAYIGSAHCGAFVWHVVEYVR